MDLLQLVLFGLLAFLLGSIPTAIWIGKWFYQIDIREHGSGNAGFSNALRVMGPKAGIPVLLIDVAKGYLAVKLAQAVPVANFSDTLVQLIPILYGLLAFLGHLFPAFANFKGGKGVATGLGMILAIFPLGAAIGLGVFLLVILSFRMMSLGSMLAGLSFPVTVLITQKISNPILLVISAFIAISIIYTHRSNIQRIIRGKENKIWFKKNRD